MRSYCGPLYKTFEALDGENQKGLEQDLRGMVASHNHSGDETAVWLGEYLEVVATKR